jgi:hypothetical protein
MPTTALMLGTRRRRRDVLEDGAPGSRVQLHEDRLGHPADTPSVRG